MYYFVADLLTITTHTERIHLLKIAIVLYCSLYKTIDIVNNV